MSPEEREAWMNRLAALSWETREPAIYALLDRVEQLERELAAARAAPRKPKPIFCPACGKEDFRRHLGTRQCYECGHQWEESPVAP